VKGTSPSLFSLLGWCSPNCCEAERIWSSWYKALYVLLFEVPRCPANQISFEDHVGRLEHPAQLALVGESDTNVEHAFLKYVLGPIHNFPFDARILLAWSLKARR
jgi:uncharacterized iron-regulated protein